MRRSCAIRSARDAQPSRPEVATRIARPTDGRTTLLEQHRMDAAVPRPARFGLVLAERQLLAVADGREPIGGDALSDVVVLHALRALRAEAQVVLDGAAAVAVAFELDLGARVLSQPFEVL